MAALIKKATQASVQSLATVDTNSGALGEILHDLQLFISDNKEVATLSEVTPAESLGQLGQAITILHQMDNAVLESKEWQTAILESI